LATIFRGAGMALAMLTRMASPRIISRRPSAKSPISARAGIKRSSISSARTLSAPRSKSARVNPPGPGPISAMWWPCKGSARRAILSVRFMSSRKCCPSRLFAPRPCSRTVSARLGKVSMLFFMLLGMTTISDYSGLLDGRDKAVRPR